MKNTTTTPDIFKLSSGLRCRPGDLAILGGGAFPENLGCIVEILTPAGVDDKLGFEWNVRSAGRKLKSVLLEDPSDFGFDHQVISPDRWLTPITGLPLEEETEVEDGVAA